ncbi:MAG: hypothetical protein WCC94_11705 [Candidatus Bathyarchaeia archaeon]
MTIFFLTVMFKTKFEKWRRFPQDAQPMPPGSWSELEGMILTACMRVFLDPQFKGPLKFRVEGSVPLVMKRRDPFARKPKPVHVMRLIVELNPLRRSIKVLQYIFAATYGTIQDDLESACGLPDRRRRMGVIRDDIPSWFKSGAFDPTKVRRMPQPQRNEYAIARPTLVRPENPYGILPRVERYEFPGRR